MQQHVADFATRMAAIQTALTACTSSTASSQEVKEGEDMLEEFNEIVESIDNARDLQAVGGLPVLKALMHGEHAGLRWRAADVLATACQNNPPVQVRMPVQLFVHRDQHAAFIASCSPFRVPESVDARACNLRKHCKITMTCQQAARC